MLTARTKNGNPICLGNDYNKETLVNLRKREEFYCPVCGESVLLKLGDQRIFHFAHRQGGNCREFYENESFYHMEGKRELFQWLQRQRIPAILEYYDQIIQQRPDIMFEYKGRKYALEYQCSSIKEEIFLKRTNTYLLNGYTPIWIIGGKQMHQKKQNIGVFNSFHYLFLQKTSEESFYIPSYCPEMRRLQLFGSIFPYSIKNTFMQPINYPLDEIGLDQLINPTIQNGINFRDWTNEIERMKYQWSILPSKRNGFHYELYNHNLNLCLLPPEIGLPVLHGLYIQSSPIIWQTYLFLDLLANKNPGDLFGIEEAKYFFTRRIKRNEIIIRNLPQIQDLKPFDAVLDYFNILEKLGILSRLDRMIQIRSKLSIPQSNWEKEEMHNLFFQKYLELQGKR